MSQSRYRDFLLVYILTAVVVARPAAAWSGAPGNAREARRADSRHPIRKGGKQSSSVGQRLVFDFAEQHLADELELVQQIFSRRGAYRGFKDFLEQKGLLLQSWYDFESQREEESLREWALDNKIELKTL